MNNYSCFKESDTNVAVVCPKVFVDTQQGQKIKIKMFDEDKTSDDESLGS